MTKKPREKPQTDDAAPIDPEQLALLVCPLTRSPLRQEGSYLVGMVGGLRYPIRDGILRLLPEMAELSEGIESLDEFKEKFADQIPR